MQVLKVLSMLSIGQVVESRGNNILERVSVTECFALQRLLGRMRTGRCTRHGGADVMKSLFVGSMAT
eukprot:432972-Amphidinium_carterae.1